MPTRRELANAIRALSMDAVQRANSGHPGMPMGMADIAEVLWNDTLRHNPANPDWVDRDRFVVSNGHGSMLLYSLLHLTGYDLSIDELKNFRQLHSKTPGHPEYGYAPGVETTTGPLGQGISNAVGMALAEKMLASHFNQPGYKVVDHYTYSFLGDGCLMEGISHEVCSLAGTLGLGRLIVFYDDNGISIDGEVEGWFTDDTPERFESYGWHVVPGVDGHDPDAIKNAIELARSAKNRPTLICCKTTIGFGSPNKGGTEGVHGAPLGDEEIALVRQELDWPHAPFEIPEDVKSGWDGHAKGAELEQDWNDKYDAYKTDFPELAAEFERRMAGQLPSDWSQLANDYVQQCQADGETVASRKASQMALNAFGPKVPELLGGSADLTGSNLTWHTESKAVTDADPDGNYIWYGVREFGMSAIMNGLELHGGFIPYGATFLTFSDYARNAVRMAALMKLQSIFVYTHDSIGLGEDGPTHQSIEHIPSLRMIPGLSVWRPCDTVETAVAWQVAIERRDGPTCMAYSRQGIAHQERTAEQVANIRKGGYTLVDCAGEPDAILIATGSEVPLAVESAAKLAEQGKKIRVVSMPSTNDFDQQDQAYRDAVLPPSCVKRVVVECACSEGWWKYVGLQGAVVGIDTFGESAPAGELMKHFGFTVENVVKTVESIL